MNPDFTLFVVDDNTVTRRVMQAMLAKSYTVEDFDSAAACIARLESKVPDLFLLDVEMPEMDGYELCQHLKGLAACKDVPVIFVSGYDDLEARLKGYEAGGDDFIVKPYKPADLLEKISVAESATMRRRNATGHAVESALKASGVLSQLEELKLLVKFLSVLNTCNSHRNMASAMLALLKALHLDGGLQIRHADTALTIGHHGEDRPLEVAVFSRIKDIGPLVQFKTHAAFNCPRISVAVTNMPLHDADLCERLIGHLTLATQTANAKLQWVGADGTDDEAAAGAAQGLPAILRNFAGEVNALTAALTKARADGSAVISATLHELDEAYSYLGLTDDQEKRIKAIAEHSAEEITRAFAQTETASKNFTNLVARLSLQVLASKA